MNSAEFLDQFSRVTSRLTQWFPRGGAKFLDGLLYPLLGNDFTVDFFDRHNRENLESIGNFQRILVVSDIHIGDAVLLQTAVSALRDFFPKAEIDYLVKKSMENLLQGNPDISELWPAFTGGQFPNEKDILTVQALAPDYDAVFNLCPFLAAPHFPEPKKAFHFTSRAPFIIRNERNPSMPGHLAYQAHKFIYDMLSPHFAIQRARPFEGPQIFLAHRAVAEAHQFFRQKAPKGLGPVVFLNPDTASPYTRIPFGEQAKLLKRLVEMPFNGDLGGICRVLLGEGHTDKGIGERLWFSLPLWLRDRVTLVPASMELDTYSALIDWSDVFISGDTGPLHIAAARKHDRSKNTFLRNRTSVFSVFGGTPPRFSGYDSELPGFLESSQDAESRSYQSISRCRNITCLHKMARECDASGCFQELDLDKIFSDIRYSLTKAELLQAGV